MAKANYFLICENFISSESVKPSIVNIFDAMASENLPGTPMKFVIATSVAIFREDVKNKKVEIQLEIISPNGEEVLKGESSVDMPVFKKDRTNLVSGLDLGGQIALKVYGEYIVKLSVNSVEIATTLFTFTDKPQEGAV